jgi:hypothetical protein
VLRTVRVLLLLAAASVVLAQACLPEAEPNDTPGDATPVSGMGCVLGTLEPGDQDFFLWTLAPDDLRSRAAVLDLEGVPGALTQVWLLRLAVAEDGVAVSDRRDLLRLSSLGPVASTDPLLLAPGEYFIGISASGAAGRYVVTARTVDPPLPPAADREPNDDPATASEHEGPFALSGDLEGSVDVYRWIVPDDAARRLWSVEAWGMPEEPLTLTLSRASGALIVRGSVDARQRVTFHGLGLEPGAYLLEVGPGADGPSPYVLAASSQGVVTDGHEVEPNDQRWEANSLDIAVGMRGALGPNDRDTFRFVVDDDAAGFYRLDVALDTSARLCLFDAQEVELLCQSGHPLGLPSLRLEPGAYGLTLDGSTQQADYTLTFTPTTAPPPDHEEEPNNTLATATPLGDGLAVRGAFSAREADVYAFSIEGEAQLVRVQVVGDGVEAIRSITAAGVVQQELHGAGERRLRLEGLTLFPGRHYLEVRGEGGAYILTVVLLGPAPLGSEPLAAGEERLPDPTGDPAAGTVARQRPAGVLELEPNDDDARALPLRFDQTYVGTLANLGDRDGYRFSLRNDGYVRVEVVPGEGGQVYMDVGRVRTESLSEGEPLVFERWLLAGDYFVYLYPRIASDEYYRLRVDLLDPFALPDDLEPNDTPRQASPLPTHRRPVGVVGQHNDRDWYALPLFDSDTPVAVEVVTGRLFGLELYDLRSEVPLPESVWDPIAQVLRGVVPAGVASGVRVDGRGRYELQVDLGDGGEVPSDDGGLAASLELDRTEVAAFWSGGQRLPATLTLENASEAPQRVRIELHASDSGVVPEGLPETAVVAPRATATIPFTVSVGPDVPDDQPLVLTVGARTELATASAGATLHAICEAPPVGGFQHWPLPDAVLGTFNVALLAFGAQVVESDGSSDRDAELFDGRVSPVTGAVREPGQSVVVALPGDGPTSLVGTILHPLGRGDTSSQLETFEVAVSLDGHSYRTVLQGALRAARQEQAFVFDQPVEARFARLTFTTKHDDAAPGPIHAGEWKLLSRALPLASVNLADPRLGGHVVWSDPLHAGPTAVLSDPATGGVAAHPMTVVPDGGTSLEWVVGFHHGRAAQLERLEWIDHDHSQPERRLDRVDVYGSIDGPLGPWTLIAEWTLARAAATLDDVPAVAKLDVPPSAGWTRYLRFVVPDLEAGVLHDLPETIRAIERRADDAYPSVVGEWGLYETAASFEYRHPQAIATAIAMRGEGHGDRATARPLDGTAGGHLAVGEGEDWYWFEVPEGDNQLTLRFDGDPAVGFAFEVQDAHGAPVEAEVRRTANAAVLTATVDPGRYYLRLYEPPRSVVFSWDTSGSVALFDPVLYGSLARFASQIRPGRESVALLAFDEPLPRFLSPDWMQRPDEVMLALSRFDRSAASSSAESALLEATRALAGREGTKAVLLMTDAESSSYGATPALWRALGTVQPRVFTFEVSSAGSAPSQDLMQDWAAAGRGVYTHAATIADFDVGFARASCHLRRPKGYTVSVATAFAQPAPGRVLVRRQATEPAAPAAPDRRPAVQVILDASGSMQRLLDGRPRYQIANEVLTELVTSALPPGVPFALRVFGNREANSCRSDLEVPLAPLDPAAVSAVIASIVPQPFAGTPLAASLRHVADDLRGVDGPKTVILITDGEESCGGDVAAEILGLRAQGIDVAVTIVGFDLDAEDPAAARARFEAWAELGGGRYHEASGLEELASSLTEAVRPQAVATFEVVDAAGRVVARGTVEGEAVEVPAGSYTVRVAVVPPHVVDLRVSSDRTSTVTLDDAP